MEYNKIKILKKFSTFFLTIGILGVIDILTRGAGDLGMMSAGIFFLFKPVFGIDISSVIASIISKIIAFSLLWILISLLINRKIKLLQNPGSIEGKNYKRAKIAMWIFIVFFSSLFIYALI